MPGHTDTITRSGTTFEIIPGGNMRFDPAGVDYGQIPSDLIRDELAEMEYFRDFMEQFGGLFENDATKDAASEFLRVLGRYMADDATLEELKNVDVGDLLGVEGFEDYYNDVTTPIYGDPGGAGSGSEDGNLGAQVDDEGRFIVDENGDLIFNPVIPGVIIPNIPRPTGGGGGGEPNPDDKVVYVPSNYPSPDSNAGDTGGESEGNQGGSQGGTQDENQGDNNNESDEDTSPQFYEIDENGDVFIIFNPEGDNNWDNDGNWQGEFRKIGNVNDESGNWYEGKGAGSYGQHGEIIISPETSVDPDPDLFGDLTVIALPGSEGPGRTGGPTTGGPTPPKTDPGPSDVSTGTRPDGPKTTGGPTPPGGGGNGGNGGNGSGGNGNGNGDGGDGDGGDGDGGNGMGIAQDQPSFNADRFTAQLMFNIPEIYSNQVIRRDYVREAANKTSGELLNGLFARNGMLV